MLAGSSPEACSEHSVDRGAAGVLGVQPLRADAAVQPLAPVPAMERAASDRGGSFARLSLRVSVRSMCGHATPCELYARLQGELRIGTLAGSSVQRRAQRHVNVG